jgi:hypothetical protein
MDLESLETQEENLNDENEIFEKFENGEISFEDLQNESDLNNLENGAMFSEVI